MGKLTRLVEDVAQQHRQNKGRIASISIQQKYLEQTLKQAGEKV